MLTSLKFITAFSISLLVVGCAMTGQPERAQYSGVDNVTAISSDMLVGNWNVRILNPIEGEETLKEASVFYQPNGTVIMRTLSQTASGPMGTIALEMSGTWVIEGESVHQRLDDIKETSGNSVAQMLIGMMGSTKERFSGTANVYEASRNRIVLVSDNGQAQELNRIQ